MKSKSLLFAFLFATLISLVLGHSLQLLTMSKLKQLRNSFNNVHYFVFIDETLLAEEHFELFLPQNSTLKYFYTDCSGQILKACEKQKNSPIALLYNKIVIDFELHNKNSLKSKSIHQYAENVQQWVESVLSANAYVEPSPDKIRQLLQVHESVFVMVENKTLKESEVGFRILAKEYPFKKFVFLRSPQVSEEFNLTQGQFTLLLSNGSKIGEYPSQYPSRYDIWRMYVSEKLFPNLANVKAELAKNRLNRTEDRVLVFCDLSVRCVQFWEQIDAEMGKESTLQKLNSITKIIYKSDSLKNVRLLELFYHIKLTNGPKLPFILILNGEDQQNKGIPARYLYELSNSEHSYLEDIISSVQKVDSGNEENFIMSSGVPKKDGFTGKGSQKTVQKLSYETYWQQINKAKSKGTNYIVFITAFNFNCHECEKFYTQYKKLSSFLKAEDRSDIIFGVLDLSKDQVPIQLEALPLLILYKASQEEPMQYNSRMDFQHVLKFINSHSEQGSPQNNDRREQKKENRKDIETNENDEEL